MSEILVLKLGGTTLAEQQQVLAEVAAVARRRPVVIVHGGGKRMTEWLDRLGVPTRFEGGLRVTDGQALEVAAAVLRGVVNSELVAALRDLGVDAVGLSGVDGGLLIAERVPGMGLVAHVVGIRRDLLDAILVTGQVPVVAPLARDEGGIVCNVNADDAAAGLAAGLGARQLVLMTDVDGIRGADGTKVATLTAAEAEAPDRGRDDLRRHGPQDPGRPRGDHRPGGRGDHLRRGGARGARAGPRRPGLRHASHGRPRRHRRGGMSTPPSAGTRAPARPVGAGETHRAARRLAILDLVAARSIGSQEELAGLLRERGFAVTQATVSRDIADLGLVKAPRGDHHAYVTPQALTGAPEAARAARVRGDDRAGPGAPRPRRDPAAADPRRPSRRHRPQRPDPGPRQPPRGRVGDRPGDRRVEPRRPGRHARRRQHAPGPLRRRARPRALAGPLRRPRSPGGRRPARGRSHQHVPLGPRTEAAQP